VRADIAITRRCNLTCTHCCNADDRKGWQHDMSTAEALLVIDRLADGGVSHVLLFGGEATLRRDFLTLAEHAVKRGMVPWLTTNGTRLSDAHIERLAQLDVCVSFSIDGASAEINDGIRGAGVYDGVISSIRRFVQARQSGDPKQPVQANYSLMRANLDEAVPALYLLAESGVDVIAYVALQDKFPRLTRRSAAGRQFDQQNLTPTERVRVGYELATAAQEAGVIAVLPLPELVLDLFRERLPGVRLETALEHRCSAGQHTVGVTNDGRLTPCGFNGVGDREDTTLLTNSFRQVYFSDVFTDFIRTANDAGNTAQLDPLCQTCDYRLRKMCQPKCFMGFLPYDAPVETCKVAGRVLSAHRSAPLGAARQREGGEDIGVNG
jgi:MoaA/NifB/PqqE/SkfB family radical SAM enzyme